MTADIIAYKHACSGMLANEAKEENEYNGNSYSSQFFVYLT
jgi:hypothetical protein